MARVLTTKLLDGWEYGQTPSERMCAELLKIEGYEEIQPQAPLGGPDGRKDILCRKDNKKWVAAAFFPSTHQTFSKVKKKFLHDFEGVKRHKAEGFVFFTNQSLTVSEAEKIADLKKIATKIYDVEQIRLLLDAPIGYGVRLEYLGVEMTKEDQIAFWSVLKDDFAKQIGAHQSTLTELRREMLALAHQTRAFIEQVQQPPSLLFARSLQEGLASNFPTSHMSLGQLLWLHRLVLGNAPSSARVGILRNTNVWIGAPGSNATTAKFTPVPAANVKEYIEGLLASWRVGYLALVEADERTRFTEIASFHHKFLEIHPFLDGNGRIARVILRQQVRELIGVNVDSFFSNDVEAYYGSLAEADNGNLHPLTELIKAHADRTSA